MEELIIDSNFGFTNTMLAERDLLREKLKQIKDIVVNKYNFLSENVDECHSYMREIKEILSTLILD